MTLQELLATMKGLSGVARDAVVLCAPELHVTWELCPVPVIDARGKQRGELRVTADVFSIGTPDAPVRVPLSGPGAQALADRLGMLLPTARMASLIYNAGTVVLKPKPMTPPCYPYDHTMVTTERFQIHNGWVESQRGGLNGLVVGHKKDVVITKRLSWRPERVAIFGWFNSKDKPLQPFQQPHEAEYADYSHGVRLVAPMMVLDGRQRNVADVLRDPATAWLLSDEGPIDLSICRYRSLREPGVPASTQSAPAPVPQQAARSLRLGSRGEDVRAWQEKLLALGYPLGTADGIFGARTDTATRAFQSEHGLRIDGVVGPNTLKAAAEATGRGTSAAEPTGTLESNRFLQAAHYTATDGRSIDLVVLHSTENETKVGVADAVAQMFAHSDREASAHYVIGPEEVIGCVREKDVAWAAPGANNDGVQIEMVGRAAYSAGDWQGAHQQAMIARAVRLVAGICRRHNIPVRLVDVDGLLRGERGITTHANVSKAFKKSTHWDPGPNFPLDDFLARVAAAVAAAPGRAKAAQVAVPAYS